MLDLSIALVGNPNTGKSTIFSKLTGANQKIGNWPGVTVEKKEGKAIYGDYDIKFIDLPGTYSINARSAEEKIVMDYLLNNPLDVVMDVLDSSNIERNLFLTLQLLEKGIPLLLVLNMQDEAKRHGVHIDSDKLKEILGFPVTKATGRQAESVQQLKSNLIHLKMSEFSPSARLITHIEKIKDIEASNCSEEEKVELAIKERYAFIDEIVAFAVDFTEKEVSMSEKLDRYLANGIMALPIFFVIMYSVFQITFEWIGQPLADALGDFIAEDFTTFVGDVFNTYGVAEWVQSLVIDGIIGGVGAVVVFVPLIFILFFCLSFLDGTGYMARVAFIMDPIMRRIGLTGKGIMPLIVGFGCGVPAIMGARALDSEKDRMISMLTTPFLTCGAKLPIMALFAAAFFPDYAGNVVFAMYFVGIGGVILSAKLLGNTVFPNHGSTFLLELPPYRFPEMKNVLLETWDKGKGYLIKAGTIIFLGAVMIWFLGAWGPNGMTPNMEDSYLAIIGDFVGTLFYFHGFATWQAGASLLTGILAKEAIVSTMGILYGITDISAEASISTSMSQAFTVASALSFMVFAQLYTPCITSLATIRKETGNTYWAIFSAVYTFVFGWLASLIIYRIGVSLGY